MARKPKLAVVGGPEPGPGHNSTLSDDQARALHLSNHVPAYEKALSAKKEADAHFKNVCKTIKADGGNIDEVKLTIKLRTPEGEQELKAELERKRRIAAWSGLAVGQQGWLLDEDPRPITERASEEGKKAGLEGKDANPPYAAGTEAYDAWMQSWHASQAIMAAGFKQGPKPDAELLRDEGKKDGGTIDEFDAAASE